MTAKADPDINDTLRREGEDAARQRHDEAWANKGNGRAKALRFQIKPFEAIKLSTEPNYRIVGILPRVGLVVVWGPPKCGKSFWTFDLVMHIALGRKYRGRKVQQGMVIYLALEGGAGFAARKEAWRQRHLADQKELVPFNLIDVPVDLIADHKTLIDDIEAQVSEIPAIVAIDTLNRSLNGSESKDEDMGKYIRAADTIRARFGCLVIIIHHCGVAGQRPRGHTSLTGADDAQIAVYREKDGDITVTVEHMKDGEASAPMASKLEPVTVGINDEGDPITSCVIVETDVVDKKKAKKEQAKKDRSLPGDAEMALRELQSLISRTPDIPQEGEMSGEIPPGAKVGSAAKWRERFCNSHPDKSDNARQKAFVRAVRRLQKDRLIGIWGDKVWLAGQTGQTGHFEGKSDKMSGERSKPEGTGCTDAGHGSTRTLQDIPPMGMSGMSGVRVSGSSGSFDLFDESEEGPITDDERQQLRERGFAECDISAFTPAQARDILNPKKRESGAREASAYPFQIIAPEPDAPCVQCGGKDGQVYLIRDPFRGVAGQPLHERCAALWFKRLSCAHCGRSNGELRECRREPDPNCPVVYLHETCMEAWVAAQDRKASAAKSRLGQARIRELADWYKDETHRRYNENRLNTPELDRDLRDTLRKEVPPELLEAAFKQVMELALAV